MVLKYVPLLATVVLVVGLGCSKDRKASKEPLKDSGERAGEAEEKESKEVIRKQGAGRNRDAAKQRVKKVAKEEAEDNDREDTLGPNLKMQNSNISKRKKRDSGLPVRKIKYTADLKVIVEDLDKAQKELDKLISAIPKAYVAQSEINPSPGTVRHGFWRVRIPIDAFKSFREQVAGLGEVEVNKIDSEDLTEEY